MGMMPNWSARIIGVFAAGFVFLLLIVAAIHFWQLSRSRAAQSRVEASQAAAASNSAADAVNTVAASGEREAASEALTRSNERDIRNAQGSTASVDPAVRDAGLRALCMRRAYSSDARCRVLVAHP
jgi:Flp pilus assembly protein TadB